MEPNLGSKFFSIIFNSLFNFDFFHHFSTVESELPLAHQLQGGCIDASYIILNYIVRLIYFIFILYCSLYHWTYVMSDCRLVLVIQQELVHHVQDIHNSVQGHPSVPDHHSLSLVRYGTNIDTIQQCCRISKNNSQNSPLATQTNKIQ